MKKPTTYTEVLFGGFCQYITGDPKKDPVFCSNKKVTVSAYCLEHDKLCQPHKYKENADGK